MKLLEAAAFRRALLGTVLAQGANLFMSMAALLLISRQLGPAGKGTQALLVTTGQMLSIAAGGGLAAALPAIIAGSAVRAAAAWRSQQKWILGVLLASGFIWLALRNTLMPSWITPASAGFGVAFFTIAATLHTFATSMLMAVGEAKRSNLAILVASGAWILGTVILALYDSLTPVTAVTAQAVGFALGTLFVRDFLPRAVPPLSASEASVIDGRIPLLSFASSITQLLLFRADIFLVDILLNRRAAGMYSLAIFSAELVLRAPQWAATVIGPVVAVDRVIGLRRTLRLFTLSISLAVVCFLGIVILRQPLEALAVNLAGSGYSGIIAVVIPLMPRIVVQSGISVLAGNLAGLGFTVWHPLASLFGMIAVVSLDLLLIPHFGLVGAGMGSSLGYLAAAATILFGFLRKNDLRLGTFIAALRWRT